MTTSPATMRALRYEGPGVVNAVDLVRPIPGPDDVLVEIAACGVCATDVKTFLRGHPKIAPGTVLGHEVAGRVVQAPSGAMVTEGDLVAVAPYVPCGRCRECKRGRATLCPTLTEHAPVPGGFTELLLVPGAFAPEALVRWPSDRPLLNATLAEPLACSLQAMANAAVSPGDRVLIIGDGPMSLLQAAVATHRGAEVVIVAGITPWRLEAARHVANVTLDVRDVPLSAHLKALYPEGVDVVSVSVPAADALEQATAVVAPGGVIELFAGMPTGTLACLDAGLVHYRGVRLQGSFGCSPQYFREAIELLAADAIPGEVIITDLVGIEELPEAMRRAGEHHGVKTVLVPPASFLNAATTWATLQTSTQRSKFASQANRYQLIKERQGD